MCAIAGFLGDFEESFLGRMADSMAHRGPDGSGVFFDGRAGAGLAHRRLSIIDLTDAGRQPMADASGSVILSFNGEIYNYRELRSVLEAEGTRFKGHSDTEVLLQLYLRDGPDMLGRLNGIFSFAIWDRRDQTMFIARDGAGVKPLYYTQDARGVSFASEIKALLKDERCARTVDPTAIAQHLAYLWCPSPRTVLRGVHKLPSGNALLVRAGRIVRQWAFYDLPYAQPRRAWGSPAEAADAVREALATAVQRQMVADVRVGAFLSGGLDSSSVVAFARAHTRERLQCFTIDTGPAESSADGMVADLPYAREAARHLDVDLHVIDVRGRMHDHIEEMIFHLDEPQADPAPLNALFIAGLARNHGVKVLLSGAGGDDVFTGYRRHWALQQERYWAWMPRGARGLLSGAARSLPATSAFTRRVRKALEYADLDPQERIASYFNWLPPAGVLGLLAPEVRAAVEPEAIAQPLMDAMRTLPADASALHRMLYLEGKFFLADHNLNYTDKMAMAHGVEVRVPFLDPDLVQLAASIRDAWKQRGACGKWVLKKAMEAHLPPDIVHRPKTGFGVPLRKWMHRELRPLVEDTLSRSTLSRRGLFDADAVQVLLRQDRAGAVDATYPLFAVLCTEIWCRRFLDAPIVPAHAGAVPIEATSPA